MKFEDRQIILKDGRTCILTPTVAKYAEEMIDYLKDTAGESEFLLRYPDEINYTVDGEIDILNQFYEDERTIMMLALVDGKVAGNGSINSLSGARRLKHRGSLAIALKKEYWGLGIGRAMMDYMTELAHIAGYEQIELGVIEGNDRAKALYEKCGFIECGRNVNAMKYDDGTYRDEILMWKKCRSD